MPETAEEKKDKTEAAKGPVDIKNMDTKQKAAIVVVSLGADRASQIYKYLNEQDIEDLTYEVAKMGRTTNSQVEGALDEFYKLCLTHKMMTDGGLDYARNVLWGDNGQKPFGEGVQNPSVQALQLLYERGSQSPFVPSAA